MLGSKLWKLCKQFRGQQPAVDISSGLQLEQYLKAVHLKTPCYHTGLFASSGEMMYS